MSENSKAKIFQIFLARSKNLKNFAKKNRMFDGKSSASFLREIGRTDQLSTGGPLIELGVDARRQASSKHLSKADRLWHTACLCGSMRVCWSVSMALIAVLTSRPAQASSPLEFPIEIRQGFLWTEVTISLSAKPLHFLLDTGASASVMDIGIARELGLKLADTVSVSGVQSKITGRKLQRCHLKSGEVPLPSPPIAIDLSQLSQACQTRVDGLIGADFFRNHIVEIDSAARRVRLRHSLLKAETNAALPLEMRACGMRVPITINGRKMQWVRLDTGCASALQWVSSGVPADQCLRRTAIGLSQLSIPQIQTTVSMSEHTFTNVPTGLHTTAIFPGECGLIGNGLLLRFSKFIVDGKSNRLILRPWGLLD